MTQTVLITDRQLHPNGLKKLENERFRVIFLTNTFDAMEVERLMATRPIDAVISRTLPLTGGAIDVCPTLKVVSKHGVGVDNIDVAACSRRGIPVYSTPGANAQSVAEMTLALMLAAARRIPLLHSEVRAGRWTRLQDGVQLQGLTLGVVGFGYIGHKVARICEAFGMSVQAHDPMLDGDFAADGVPLRASLDELLQTSDVVSLHMPLTPQTRGILDERRLALLRPGAILVNTARGELIDEPALVEALSRGRLFAAGLDTMAVEPPPPDSALRRLDNVVLAPHVGGSTVAALGAMALMSADNVIRHLRRQPVDPARCANPEVLLTPAPRRRN